MAPSDDKKGPRWVLIIGLILVGLFIIGSLSSHSDKDNGEADQDQSASQHQPLDYTRPIYTDASAIICPKTLLFDPREDHGPQAIFDAFTSVFHRTSAAQALGCEVWQSGVRVYAQRMSEPFDNFVAISLSPNQPAMLFTMEGNLRNATQAEDAMTKGAAELDNTLRTKPWMQGFLRAMGVNPASGSMPPLSPAESRCKAMMDRQNAECTGSASTQDGACSPAAIQNELQNCENDLKQEWLAKNQPANAAESAEQNSNQPQAVQPTAPQPQPIQKPASAAATAASPGYYWYYCDPAKAYYPYVGDCPVPWRKVAPTQNSNGQQ